jgi:GMP synthase (glutamine-hydrolysing)
MALKFLIIDGYPKPSRDQFEEVGMRLAWVLYRDMLLQHVPDAECDVWLTSDDLKGAPTDGDLKGYAGLLWPGCNLTIYHEDDQRVAAQLDLARRAYEVGTPGFGSCWGIQVACYSAGGEVAAHPKGREMGIARNIQVMPEGKDHPMFRGMPPVFSHLVSHDDHVTRLPEGAALLAGNAWSQVQAVAVNHRNGVFWGTQYHPEYDIHEMARLILAREEKLVRQGLFLGHEDLVAYVDRLEALSADPTRTDLRWQLGIDDDILVDELRQNAFANWLDAVVLPRVKAG